MSYIYEQSGIKGDLTPDDVIKFLDNNDYTELINLIKSVKAGRVKSFLAKIRAMAGSDSVKGYCARQSAKQTQR